MKSLAVALGLSAALVALPAAAQLNLTGLYAGVGVGQSKAKDWCTGAVFVSCDDKDTAWKVFGGYQFTPNFAAEIGYSNLGKFTASGSDPFFGFQTDNAKVTAWEWTALGTFPVMNRLAVLGRLGLYRANVKESNSVFGNFEHDNTDWTFGVGVQYDIIRNLAIRGEWQRYRKIGGGDVAFGAGVGEKSDLDVLGVSALWRF